MCGNSFILALAVALSISGAQADSGLGLRRTRAGESMKVHPRVRVGRVVRYDAAHHRMVLRSQGHTWTVPVTNQTIGIKNGTAVKLNAFQAGDLAVVQGYNTIYANTISDPMSFAVFIRDSHFIGTVVSFTPATMTLTFRGAFSRFAQESAPPTPIGTDQFKLLSTTQYWLDGKRVTALQAIAALQPGKTVHITNAYDSRRRELVSALFDTQSWKQFAQSELRNPKRLYQPTKTISPTTRDTSP